MNHRRRQFLKKSFFTSIAAYLGMDNIIDTPFKQHLKSVKSNLAHIWNIPGKSKQMTVLNERPINIEAPAHLLNDKLTPSEFFFVRNNGIPPQKIDSGNWKITIGGESAKQEISFSIDELKSNFDIVNYNITLECGGNGRSEYNPPAKGNQWSTGAVGCVKWTGVRLRDVLNHVGIKSDAVYIGYYGADTHLSGDPDKMPISRGVPISKALEPESLIAWSMNDEDLPLLNGYPLRLVFGGYPASCSGKWLEKIVIRNQVHDGPKMTGSSYRVPCYPVAPGAKVEDDDMCIIEAMPVKSLITYPKTGASITLSQSLPIEGHAWTSSDVIKQVEYSINYGSSWKPCNLSKSDNKYAWQHFDAKIKFPKQGYYEVWARATDSNNNRQPIILPGWNPKGYLNNACHRIAIKVTS